MCLLYGTSPRVVTTLVSILLDVMGANATAGCSLLGKSVFAETTPVFLDPVVRTAEMVDVALYVAAVGCPGAGAAPKEVQAPLARISAASLYALSIVTLCAQRASSMQVLHWPSYETERTRAMLTAVHGPTVGASACRLWTCMTCCIMYTTMVGAERSPLPVSNAEARFALGAHGACARPCPKCFDIRCLTQAHCTEGRGPCNDHGTLGVCAEQVPADCRVNKLKRCNAEMATFDLSAVAFTMGSVCVTRCQACPAVFRYVASSWGPWGILCRPCTEFARDHGRLPSVTDLAMGTSAMVEGGPSVRRDAPHLCAICSHFVPDPRAPGVVCTTVVIESKVWDRGGSTVPGSGPARRQSQHRMVTLCAAHGSQFTAGGGNALGTHTRAAIIRYMVAGGFEAYMLACLTGQYGDLDQDPPPVNFHLDPSMAWNRTTQVRPVFASPDSAGPWPVTDAMEAIVPLDQFRAIKPTLPQGSPFLDRTRLAEFQWGCSLLRKI